MTVPVTRVPYVYGGHYYVATGDLYDPSKTYLTLYTRTGARWDETKAGLRALTKRSATMLHRDNIGTEIRPDDGA